MLSGITQKTLNRYQEATEKIEASMRRLAEGKPDLGSADKVKSTRISNTIHTLKTANKVVKQNQDLLETALAGTDAIHAVVVKMKEVAAEAQDDQLTSEQRQALVDEYNTLAAEIDFVAENTEYDGTELIDGSFGTKTITIDGPSSDQDVSIALGDLTLEGLEIGAYTDSNNQAVAASSLSSVLDAEDAVIRLEAALATLETERSNQIAKIERFDFTISHLGNMIRMNEEAVATINDFDEAAEMANLTSYQIEQQTALALMAQANQLSTSVLQLLGG
jgi:flagellin